MSIPAHIHMRPITGSKNIFRIGHDADNSRLYVDFGKETPRVYSYEGVGADDAKALLDAHSKGSHFAANIKGRFPYQRVEG